MLDSTFSDLDGGRGASEIGTCEVMKGATALFACFEVDEMVMLSILAGSASLDIALV